MTEKVYKAYIALWTCQILTEKVYKAIWTCQILTEKIYKAMDWKSVQGYSLVNFSNFDWKVYKAIALWTCQVLTEKVYKAIIAEFLLKKFTSLVNLSNFDWKSLQGYNSRIFTEKVYKAIALWTCQIFTEKCTRL